MFLNQMIQAADNQALGTLHHQVNSLVITHFVIGGELLGKKATLSAANRSQSRMFCNIDNSNFEWNEFPLKIFHF